MLVVFTPWQKLQYWLVILVVTVFFVGFACMFFGYQVPDDALPYLMVFWTVVCVFIDTKEIGKLMSSQNTSSTTTATTTVENKTEPLPTKEKEDEKISAADTPADRSGL